MLRSRRSRLLSPATLALSALPLLASAAIAAQPDEDGLTPIGEPGSSRAAADLGGGFIEFLFTGRTHDVPAPSVRSSSAMLGAPVQRSARIPAVDPKFDRQLVAYEGSERPGTIVVDTSTRFLYLVQDDGQAMRYGVGVGREGFEWHGRKTIERKAEWPDWRPPAEMIKRRPDLPAYMPGGIKNPLGARAMYLSGTLYRIHGSNEPWSIGQAVSSGCIRMRNEDVEDLYQRVKIGTPVVVL